MQTKKNKGPKINSEIKFPKIRLIGVEGDSIGVLKIKEALEYAQKNNLDLVEVSSISDPPVCKIMDYGRFKYENQKKTNTNKKKQKTTLIKEIKMRPNIGEGDYIIKQKKIVEFISNGNKVRVFLKFRGREIVHKSIGLNLLTRLSNELSDIATVIKEPGGEGHQILMVLSPIKK